MDKHTPGPWGAHKSETGPWAISSAPGIWVATTNRRQWPAEDLANARLIAAAPDLLQACQTFAEWLRREDVGFAALGHDRSTPEGESAWREWYDGNLALCALAQKQVRAAITKARGEATC